MVKRAARKLNKIQGNRKRRAKRSVTEEFIGHVNELKLENEMHIDEIAERSGISSRHIYRILNNEVSVTLETAEKICVALGQEFSWETT